ncbi:ABC transporter substrate-binding protein [Williamsia sp. SKLECPSW1]
MNMRRGWAYATAVAAVAVMATACGGGSGGTTSPVKGGWDDIVAAAQKEGSVMLYSSQNPKILQSVKAAWSKKYPGITLDFVRGTDSDLLPRIDAENRTKKGIADVHIVTDTSYIERAAKSGAYSTDLAEGPDFANPAYNASSSVIDGRFFLDAATTLGLGWNTREVPQGISSPTDILNPRFQGRIGVVNPNGIATYIDLYDYYGKHFGADYVKRLAALKPRIYPSALGVAQALTSGEIAVSPTVQPLVDEKSAGAPVDWRLPEPTWGSPYYGYVTAVAPHPNAAQVLADFLISPEGQRAQAIGVATALPDIPGATANAQQITKPDASTLTKEYVDRQTREWQQMFTG